MSKLYLSMLELLKAEFGRAEPWVQTGFCVHRSQCMGWPTLDEDFQSAVLYRKLGTQNRQWIVTTARFELRLAAPDESAALSDFVQLEEKL